MAAVLHNIDKYIDDLNLVKLKETVKGRMRKKATWVGVSLQMAVCWVLYACYRVGLNMYRQKQLVDFVNDECFNLVEDGFDSDIMEYWGIDEKTELDKLEPLFSPELTVLG